MANVQILSIFDRVICLGHDNCGVLSFYIFCFFNWMKVPKIVSFHMANFQISILSHYLCATSSWDNHNTQL